jgi:hypothetical protein
MPAGASHTSCSLQRLAAPHEPSPRPLSQVPPAPPALRAGRPQMGVSPAIARVRRANSALPPVLTVGACPRPQLSKAPAASAYPGRNLVVAGAPPARRTIASPAKSLVWQKSRHRSAGSVRGQLFLVLFGTSAPKLAAPSANSGPLVSAWCDAGGDHCLRRAAWQGYRDFIERPGGTRAGTDVSESSIQQGGRRRVHRRRLARGQLAPLLRTLGRSQGHRVGSARRRPLATRRPRSRPSYQLAGALNVLSQPKYRLTSAVFYDACAALYSSSVT